MLRGSGVPGEPGLSRVPSRPSGRPLTATTSRSSSKSCDQEHVRRIGGDRVPDPLGRQREVLLERPAAPARRHADRGRWSRRAGPGRRAPGAREAARCSSATSRATVPSGSTARGARRTPVPRCRRCRARCRCPATTPARPARRGPRAGALPPARVDQVDVRPADRLLGGPPEQRGRVGVPRRSRCRRSRSRRPPRALPCRDRCTAGRCLAHVRGAVAVENNAHTRLAVRVYSTPQVGGERRGDQRDRARARRSSGGRSVGERQHAARDAGPPPRRGGRGPAATASSRAGVPVWTTAFVTSSLTIRDALSTSSSAPHPSSVLRVNARAWDTDTRLGGEGPVRTHREIGS